MRGRQDGLRIFITAGALALIGYVALFYFIEHRRPSRGPWVVTFEHTNGVGAMRVHHPKLGITNVHLEFSLTNAPATNFSNTVRFDFARAVPFSLPLGECVFLDTTFLPGTVTLRVEEHELELLPRVLVINHREHPWKSNERISLASDVTSASPAAKGGL